MPSEIDKFAEVRRRVDEARERFGRNEKLVQQAAKATLAWLSKNTQHYQPDGSVKGTSWWSPLPNTNNDILADLREFVFRCHLYDNGIRHMVSLLREEKIVRINDREFEEAMRFAVDYKAMALHHELVGYAISELNKNKVLTLADITQRYGFKSPVKFRDSRLAPMSELGMWKCEADLSGHSISIGVSAIHFHREAYFPIKSCFLPKEGLFSPQEPTI